MSGLGPYRYMVTLYPGVSIGPRKFVRIIEVETLSPSQAVARVLTELGDHDTHLWQTDVARIEVERVS